MRILLTVDPEIPVPPPTYGGIERIVDGLVRYLRRSGHTVALLAHPHSTAVVDARFSWRHGARAKANLLHSMLVLRAVVNRFQPHVLHSFSRLACLGPVLRRQLPKIMSYQRHTGGWNIGVAARLAGPSLQFTGCSQFICEMGRPAGGTWTAIPNFVELDRLDFRRDVPPDAPLVFLSRVESIKGPDLAIAIARASGRRLILAGNHAKSGPERIFWEREIAPHLGRNGVEYVGEVDDAQKNALLGQAAALLVPIQWDEPFGIVFAEALAAGTPVITCARGALPEIVSDGDNGFFVRNLAEGVAAVRRIHEISRAACRRTAETRFSCAVCAEQYLALYRRVIVGCASPPDRP